MNFVIHDTRRAGHKSPDTNIQIRGKPVESRRQLCQNPSLSTASHPSPDSRPFSNIESTQIKRLPNTFSTTDDGICQAANFAESITLSHLPLSPSTTLRPAFLILLNQEII